MSSTPSVEPDQSTVVAAWAAPEARAVNAAKETTMRDLGALSPRAIVAGVKHYVFEAKHVDVVAGYLNVDLGAVANDCRRRPDGFLVIAAAK